MSRTDASYQLKARVRLLKARTRNKTTEGTLLVRVQAWDDGHIAEYRTHRTTRLDDAREWLEQQLRQLDEYDDVRWCIAHRGAPLRERCHRGPYVASYFP
jgi:hypothetical protein